MICFRIGYCQRGENQPGTHMGWGLWGQQMWLSDRDLCQAFEKAVTAPAGVRFAVLNLMSANAGMRWDLEPTRAAIGYEPGDSSVPQETEANFVWRPRPRAAPGGWWRIPKTSSRSAGGD